MGEGGQGGDKRKREGQERKIVDVGGDVKKVKEKKREGWAPFLLCWGAEAERKK